MSKREGMAVKAAHPALMIILKNAPKILQAIWAAYKFYKFVKPKILELVGIAKKIKETVKESPDKLETLAKEALNIVQEIRAHDGAKSLLQSAETIKMLGAADKNKKAISSAAMVRLADDLDRRGFTQNADEIDNFLKKYAFSMTPFFIRAAKQFMTTGYQLLSTIINILSEIKNSIADLLTQLKSGDKNNINTAAMHLAGVMLILYNSFEESNIGMLLENIQKALGA